MQTINKFSAEIADSVVPEYKNRKYSCSGNYAKRWNAAYEAAEIAYQRLLNMGSSVKTGTIGNTDNRVRMP